jgi:predicted ribonuclease toxin of YeeF-YezG toxin-antitoxin module
METEKLIKLADDINQHATTPQAKSGMNLIGSEVNNILQIIKMSIDPLYNLYEIDPGMKNAKAAVDSTPQEGAATPEAVEDYDETMLWSDVKKGK